MGTDAPWTRTTRREATSIPSPSPRQTSRESSKTLASHSAPSTGQSSLVIRRPTKEIPRHWTRGRMIRRLETRRRTPVLPLDSSCRLDRAINAIYSHARPTPPPPPPRFPADRGRHDPPRPGRNGLDRMVNELSNVHPSPRHDTCTRATAVVATRPR